MDLRVALPTPHLVASQILSLLQALPSQHLACSTSGKWTWFGHMNLNDCSNSFDNSFWAWVVYTHALVNSYKDLQESSCCCRSLGLSFSWRAAHYSLVLCPGNSGCLGLPGPKLFSQLREIARLCMSLCYVLETLQYSKLRKTEGSIICFILLRDHCSSLPDVQSSENCCFIYFVRVLVHLKWKR